MTRPLSLLALAAAFGIGAAGSATRARFERSAARSDASPAARLAVRDSRTPQSTTGASTAATPPSPQVALGEKLFVSYNCGDCHGAAGAGAMAPSLQDNRWHYGGTQDEVFRSIAEGRPGGMPTWGAIIPGPEMIALAAYVRSLGEGKDLTTENFTGQTVERSGR